MKQPNSASNGDICGGVFVSLNGPVDFNTLPLDPKFDLESGKPYIYIDCMKEQYPDAQCLMKVNFIPQFEYLLKYVKLSQISKRVWIIFCFQEEVLKF